MKMRDNQASDNFQNLIYVRSVACANNSDVLHFVMSTIHVPSVLVVHTVDDKHAHLSFNWDHLLSASKLHNDSGISVSGGHTNYSFVTVFSKVGIVRCFCYSHNVIHVCSGCLKHSLCNL